MLAGPHGIFAKSGLLIVVLSIFLVSASAHQQMGESKNDGPISVSLGDVYKKGGIKIEETELSTLPSLPDGYIPVNAKVYRITTEAIAAGPYVVGFSVDSMHDEAAFRNLRILHAEPDEFDPENFVWVDRTASPPKAPGPDFSQKRIYAYSDELDQGLYVIARVLNNGMTQTRESDLEVITQGATQSPAMPTNFEISIAVKNNGPQPAADVGVVSDLNGVMVASVTASQGTCKQFRGRLYCKLGAMTTGQTATVKATLKPRDDSAGWFSFPVSVGGSATDKKPENNNAMIRLMAQPDPNLPPTVTLDKPGMEALFEPGQQVQLAATAEDHDGSIMKVEFLDDGQVLGTGTSSDAKHFSFSTDQLSNGFHVLTAVATDNGGRRAESQASQIFINGPSKIEFESPADESIVQPGTDMVITVRAIHPSVAIRSLEILLNGISVGLAEAVSDNRYSLKLHNLQRAQYYIEALATDENGLVSKAVRRMKVSTPPNIRIAAPADGTALIAGGSLEITLDAADPDTFIRDVEIYANEVLLERGPMMAPGKYAFVWRKIPPGEYVLKAVAIDDVGVPGESNKVKLSVRNRVKSP